MNAKCENRMIAWVLGLFALVGIAPTVALAQEIHECAVNDTSFATSIDEGGCQDLTTGLVWSKAINNWNWNYAVDYGENLVEGGHGDWRLPTVEELQTVYDNGAPGHFAAWIIAQGTYGWSSERQGNKVWIVRYLLNGETLLTSRNSVLDAIYVRDSGASDPCGNGTCDSGEDECNCPADCGDPPANETNCTDGVDEDCDGPADCADADCADDPECNCLPVGASCNDDAECCSNKCKGPPGGKTCK